MPQPTPEERQSFREKLEAEGVDEVRHNLHVLVKYGEPRHNWQSREAALWIEEQERIAEAQHRATLENVEMSGARWSGWTALFTGLIALLAFVTLLRQFGVI